MDDPVNSPKHYNMHGGVECIDAIEAAVEDFPSYLQGNAIKYLYRHAYKGNPIQDLEKAIWYINRLKAQYENKRIPEQDSQECNGRKCCRDDQEDRPASTGNGEFPETD